MLRQVDVTFAVVTTAIEYIRAGKLRALAVTSATRQEALPDIQAMADFITRGVHLGAGIPGVSSGSNK